MIGARDMAFPWLNAPSFWVFALSQLLVIGSFFGRPGRGGRGLDDLPAALHQHWDAGTGQTLMVAAIFVTGVASIMGGINYITTVIRLPGAGHDVHADAADRLGPFF